MANPPILHHRKSIRLKGYDYSQAGLYFITIIVQNRVCLFGHIGGASVGANNDSPLPAPQMILNDAGHIANQCWLDIPKHFPNVVLHEFIIMPNHVHGIIELVGVGANNDSPMNTRSIVRANGDSPLRSPSKTIGSIVRGYKIGVTKWFRSTGHMGKIWQRNYWEHIIRDEKSYCRISEYIKNNPQNWKKGRTIHRGE